MLRQISRGVALSLVSIIALILIGLAGYRAYQHLLDERERGVEEVYRHLSLIASARIEAVASWVKGVRKDVSGIAGDVTVRLYLEALLEGEKVEEAAGTSAERGYLRNLLVERARTGGFVPLWHMEEISAGVSANGAAGLALLNAEGGYLVSTSAFQPVEDVSQRILQHVRSRPSEQIMEGPFINLHGVRMLLLIQPVLPVQERNGGKAIGYLVAMHPAEEEIDMLLRQPGDSLKTLSVLLAGVDGRLVAQTLPKGSAPVAVRQDVGQKGIRLQQLHQALVESKVLVPFAGVQGVEMLGMAEEVPQSDWSLLLAVSRQEALGGYDDHFNSSVTQLALWGGVILALLLFVWRYGISVRLARALEERRSLSERLARQVELFVSLIDAYPSMITVLDRKGGVRVANKAMAEAVAMSQEALPGKRIEDLLGRVPADRMMRHIGGALESHGVTQYDRSEGEGEERRCWYYQVVPIDKGEVPSDEVLVIESELTELVQVKERQSRILNGINQVVLSLLGERDVLTMQESMTVSLVARDIAEAMHLNEVEVETAEYAGLLINLGKVLVPTELLAKTEPLTQEEERSIQQAIRQGASLLESIEFNGPVAEAIRQVYERWDGVGPEGLTGERINRVARILSVSWSYVGMRMPRPWRGPLDQEVALAQLTRESGVRFDPAVVAATAHFVLNESHARKWFED